MKTKVYLLQGILTGHSKYLGIKEKNGKFLCTFGDDIPKLLQQLISQGYPGMDYWYSSLGGWGTSANNIEDYVNSKDYIKLLVEASSIEELIELIEQNPELFI